MDFTFLFISILMVFAAKNNLPLVAGGLFLILLFTAKGKFLQAASVIGGLVGGLILVGYSNDVITVGGLFVIFLLLAKADSGPAPAYPGGAY